MYYQVSPTPPASRPSSLYRYHKQRLGCSSHKNIRYQADCSKVSLYPSLSFLSNNHLVKEGPECVAPVVIPALLPFLDKSLKEDRSLCLLRALRYYLEKRQDLRQGKELVFDSFKKSLRISCLLLSRLGLSGQSYCAVNYQIRRL